MVIKEIKALVYTIEIRDVYTQGHSERVATYAKEFSKYIGYDEEYQKEIFIAGLLHDLGKIGIPDNVLLKPDRLDENEFKLIKMHSTLSGYIVEKIPRYAHLAKIIRAHHENWDGSGYPDGIKGEDIPQKARILSLVDVFDALTTPRIYRKEMSLKQALDIMDNMMNKFDPFLYKKFIPFIKEYGILYLKIDFLKENVINQLKYNIFFNDTLTKLLNRQGLLTIIRRSGDANLTATMIELNIIKFKEYNFLYGIQKGDRLLKEIANRLKSYFNGITFIDEISNNKIFLARSKADRFIIFYLGHREEFLKYKLDNFIEEIEKEFLIKLSYSFLLKNKHLNNRVINEIGYLI